ncbi:MAG: hypothetical protein QME81_06885 [bacterium]|nr:hypothetical protein [bacterium]
MKGNIERLSSYQEAVEKIRKEDTGCWLIEDWNKGLLVGEGEFSKAIEEIKIAHAAYNGAFRFRAFSKSWEVFWDGQTGLLLSEQEDGEYEVIPATVLLDQDTTAFPGLQQIRGNHQKMQTHIYLQRGQKIFQRFVKFL